MSILSLSSGVAARLGLWLAVLVWGGVLAWWPRSAAAQIAPPTSTQNDDAIARERSERMWFIAARP